MKLYTAVVYRVHPAHLILGALALLSVSFVALQSTAAHAESDAAVAPDLVVTDIMSDSGDGTLDSRVCNNGNAASGGFILRTERTDGQGNVHNLTVPQPLPAGVCWNYPGGGWVFYGFTVGQSYGMSATVDPENKVVETDDSNNSFTKTLDISAIDGVDLSIGSLQTTPLSVISVGQTFSTYVSVSNIGTETAHSIEVAIDYGNGTIKRMKLSPEDVASASYAAATDVASPYMTPGKYFISVTADPDHTVSEGNRSNNKFTRVVTVVAATSTTSSVIDRTPWQPPASPKGRIFLQVESRGEAWYVHPSSNRRYYMKDGATAYSAMRSLGEGIKNTDLDTIPVGVEPLTSTDVDTDSDGLSDALESAVGTDPGSDDSDGDGYGDKLEVMTGYNPAGKGVTRLDKRMRSRLAGRILLQVESRGEAWYVNPKDGRRYFLKDGDAALQIIRGLGTGITNASLNRFGKGELAGVQDKSD